MWLFTYPRCVDSHALRGRNALSCIGLAITAAYDGFVVCRAGSWPWFAHTRTVSIITARAWFKITILVRPARIARARPACFSNRRRNDRHAHMFYLLSRRRRKLRPSAHTLLRTCSEEKGREYENYVAHFYPVLTSVSSLAASSGSRPSAMASWSK